MDWYDVDKVKEMVFDLLLEKRQLEQALKKSRTDEKYWFDAWQEANEQNQNLLAEIKQMKLEEVKMSADSAMMA